METFSIDYIVGFINRQEPLPMQFSKALSNLVDLTFNRGLYALTLEQLLSQLQISVSNDEITPNYCLKTHCLYKLVSVLQRHKVYMLPISVPNNLRLSNIVHLLKAPELSQDSDIATIQELKKNGGTNVNYTKNQLAILQNTIIKLNNFNILTRVFEGLGAMQARQLDVNQRSALGDLINERLLPHEGSRYIRCLFGYVCEYGSYTYDYSNPLYVSPPIADNLKAELIDIIARVLAASNTKLQVRPDYPYAKELQATYDRYCPNAVADTYTVPLVENESPQKIPVAQRPLSKLNFKQKMRRLLSDLEAFKAQVTDNQLAQYLQARPGYAPDFINLLNNTFGQVDTELAGFIDRLQHDLINDTNTRLMLPDLNKCELYVKTIDIKPYLNQQPTISYLNKKPGSNDATGAAAKRKADQSGSGAAQSSDYSEIDLNTPWSSVDENYQEDGAESTPAEGQTSDLMSITNGYSYTSFNQAISTGESFNAISYTWDELTHFYCCYLIYSKDKDFLHPNEDEDYGGNLEQFLKQPLKQIAWRLNHTNVFEFILKPMLTGTLTHRQQQFFETQIGNVYLFNNANPIPYLFCHSLFIFDKYLMQPKYHFNNEVFYLTLFAKEPFAINVYLSRLINKYGNMLINIPEEFYVLIVLHMILFPQDGLDQESFEISRWLLRANFSHIQLSKVVILHYLAHQFYNLVHTNPEYHDLKLHLIFDANLRSALLSQQRSFSNKKVSTKPRKTKDLADPFAFNPSELFPDEGSGLFAPEADGGSDRKEAAAELAKLKKVSNSTAAFEDLNTEVKISNTSFQRYTKRHKNSVNLIPNECNQHLNKLFMSNLDVHYGKNTPFNDSVSQDLLDNYITPILKRVISSEHRNIYMFDRKVDVRDLLNDVLDKLNQKEVPDTKFEALPGNRFIIDSFVLKHDPQQLQHLQALALEAQTVSDIGFVHVIKTDYINEISNIFFHNLHLQIVPNYYIFSEGENYAKLRPEIKYIQVIQVPEIFQQENLYAGYKDVLFSLQCAAVAIELIRALTSQINKAKDLVAALVKDVISTHNLQNYKDAISFTYNYINASFKLIDKEGRLNIDALCEEKGRLDQMLIGSRGHKRLYRMLIIALNHQVVTNKITQTFKERYVKLLVKLKIKEPSLLNMLHPFGDSSSLGESAAVMPRVIALDMEKIRDKLQESTEVQSFISKMREEEAEREAAEKEQVEQDLKERVAQYQKQQSSAGTTPSEAELAAASKTEEPEIEKEQDIDLPDGIMTQGVSAFGAKSLGGLTGMPFGIGAVASGIMGFGGRGFTPNNFSNSMEQQIDDWAPVAKLLSEKARSLIEAVALQNIEVMDLREFHGLCVSHRYMSANAAIEEINDVCLAEYDELLFEPDNEQGILYITQDILERLNFECGKIRELSNPEG